jgi:hypothetical protein
VVIPYRRLGTANRSHLQGSRNPRKSDVLALEYGPDRSRNVRNYHCTLRYFPEKCRSRRNIRLPTFWDLQPVLFIKVGPTGYPEVSIKTTDMLRNIPEERRSQLQRVWKLRSLKSTCHSFYKQASTTPPRLIATALLLHRQAGESLLVPEIKNDVFPARQGVWTP